MEEVAEEMADIFIMAIWISNRLSIDFRTAILRKLEINKQRKFILSEKGIARGSKNE